MTRIKFYSARRFSGWRLLLLVPAMGSGIRAFVRHCECPNLFEQEWVERDLYGGFGGPNSTTSFGIVSASPDFPAVGCDANGLAIVGFAHCGGYGSRFTIISCSEQPCQVFPDIVNGGSHSFDNALDNGPVSGNPVLFKRTMSGAELLIPMSRVEGGGVAHVKGIWGENDQGTYKSWEEIDCFGKDQGVVSSLAIMRSNNGIPGNVEAVCQVGDELHFYWWNCEDKMWDGPVDGCVDIPEV